MSTTFNKKLAFLPTVLTAIIFSIAYTFSDAFTPYMVIGAYWVLGSIVFYTVMKRMHGETATKVQLSVELDQQKRYLENLIGNAPEGIVWVDRWNKIKYVNKKFTEIFGYTQEDAKGANLDELISPKGEISEAQRITRSVAEGITHKSEGIRRHKDGHLIHVSIVGSPMTSMRGNLEVFGIYRDISEEKLDQEKLIESEKSLRVLSNQLMAANNFKELLLDIITHDLRNPSGVISGAIEILDSEFPHNEVVDLIRKSSNSLSQVIEDASTLSKLSLGESINMESMDIVPIMLDVAESFESQLKSADMTLSIDLPESIWILTNRVIGEVFSNYISNAIKYAHEGKALVLTAETNPGYVEIQVQDGGNTISEDQREAIFERNIQLLDGPRKGSGLGLAIVKRIAAAHHAKVGVKANEPQGNIFYFRFNISESPKNN